MPLRDHFRSPVNDRHTWEELHGMWPAMIVRQLFDLLPTGYVAAPNVHLGKMCEIAVSAFDVDERMGIEPTAAPPAPTLTLETDLAEQDEFEVRIYDAERGRHLSRQSRSSVQRTRTGRKTGGRWWPRSQPCSRRTSASRSSIS
jgi:hypothetical protein